MQENLGSAVKGRKCPNFTTGRFMNIYGSNSKGHRLIYWSSSLPAARKDKDNALFGKQKYRLQIG